jgi:hypothetical protein
MNKLIFCAALALGCSTVQPKPQTRPAPHSPIATIAQAPKPAKKQTPCEIALSKKPLVEKILGKWDEKALSKVHSVYFVEKPITRMEEDASYSAETRDITISATPLADIGQHIEEIDHEVGHAIYNEISKRRSAATEPIIKEGEKLRAKYQNDEDRWHSKEYKALNDRIDNAMISQKLTYAGWNSFMSYLQNYPHTQCIKAFLELAYIHNPRRQQHLSELSLLQGSLMASMRHKKSLSDDDRKILSEFASDVRKLNAYFKEKDPELRSAIKAASEKPNDYCPENEAGLLSMLAEQDKLLENLLGYKDNIIDIEGRVASGQSDREMRAYMLRRSAMFIDNAAGTIAMLSQEGMIKNELFARATDSLMDVYFGKTQNYRFELDEKILSSFEKIEIDGVQVFAEAVKRYRQGMEMNKKGVPLEKIQEALLSSLPSRPLKELRCIENKPEESEE